MPVSGNGPLVMSPRVFDYMEPGEELAGANAQVARLTEAPAQATTAHTEAADGLERHEGRQQHGIEPGPVSPALGLNQVKTAPVKCVDGHPVERFVRFRIQPFHTVPGFAHGYFSRNSEPRPASSSSCRASLRSGCMENSTVSCSQRARALNA